VTVQAEILELISSMKKETGMAVILITHDLDIVSQMADDVVVMDAGLIVERASGLDLFPRRAHPYTDGLLRSSLKQRASSGPLNSIPGSPPDPLKLPNGCSFHPRCSRATPRCQTESPPLTPVGDDATHDCSCWTPIDDALRTADRTGI
jgi:oligopeptide/dipeptide ABC transporter ATP-binding protein